MSSVLSNTFYVHLLHNVSLVILLIIVRQIENYKIRKVCYVYAYIQ